MASLSGPRPPTEVDVVQNPALGAVLLWRFSRAYQEEIAREVPFHLAFLVLPLLLHRGSLEQIVSTRKSSGLTLFAAKFGERRENLLAVHERACALRALTLRSIGQGVQARLMGVDYSLATVRGNTIDSDDLPSPSETVKNMLAAADKLGGWFSKMDISQIAATLRVEF